MFLMDIYKNRILSSQKEIVSFYLSALAHKTHEHKYEPNYVSASSLGRCPLAAARKRQGKIVIPQAAPEHNPGIKSFLLAADMQAALFQGMLLSETELETEIEVYKTDPSYRICGSIDAVITDPETKTRAPIEIKNRDTSKGYQESDLLQLMCYMHFLGAERGYLFLINRQKEAGEKKPLLACYRLDAEKGLFSYAKKEYIYKAWSDFKSLWLERIELHLSYLNEEKTKPPFAFADKKYFWECERCPYWCWTFDSLNDF